MARGLTPAEREVVEHLATASDDELWDHDGLVGMGRLDDAEHDVAQVAAEIAAILATLDADVVDVLDHRLPIVVADQKAMVSAVAAADESIARALGRRCDPMLDGEQLRLLPPAVVGRALVDGDAWAYGAIGAIMHPERPAAERWAAAAELLDAVGDEDVVRSRVAEAFAVIPWARHSPAFDPSRLPSTPVGERDLVRMPYSQLYDADDPLVRRAVAEVDALEEVLREWEAAGRSPDAWLRGLGRSLDGCGQHSCCRLSLLEAELVARGHRPRRWPERFEPGRR